MFKLNNIDLYMMKRDIIFDVNIFNKALKEVFGENENDNFLYIRFDNNTYFKNFNILTF